MNEAQLRNERARRKSDQQRVERRMFSSSMSGSDFGRGNATGINGSAHMRREFGRWAASYRNRLREAKRDIYSDPVGG